MPGGKGARKRRDRRRGYAPADDGQEPDVSEASANPGPEHGQLDAAEAAAATPASSAAETASLMAAASAAAATTQVMMLAATQMANLNNQQACLANMAERDLERAQLVAERRLHAAERSQLHAQQQQTMELLGRLAGQRLERPPPPAPPAPPPPPPAPGTPPGPLTPLGLKPLEIPRNPAWRYAVPVSSAKCRPWIPPNSFTDIDIDDSDAASDSDVSLPSGLSLRSSSIEGKDKKPKTRNKLKDKKQKKDKRGKKDKKDKKEKKDKKDDKKNKKDKKDKKDKKGGRMDTVSKMISCAQRRLWCDNSLQPTVT